MIGYADRNDLESKYTISDWIEEGKESLNPSRAELTYKSKSTDGTVITPYQTLTCLYYDTLAQFIVSKDLTDEEFRLYRCNPKKLSMDLYDTPELWFALLYINRVASSMQFKKRNIKIYSDGIIDALEELTSILDEDIVANKKIVYNEI